MATWIDVHRVEAKDKARIACRGQYGECQNQADVCEHVHWDTGNTTGVSFFYSCLSCYEQQVNEGA